MRTAAFLKGMGIGIMAGAAIAVATMPHKGHHGKHSGMNMMKTNAGKALRAIGDVVENIGDALS